MWHITYVWWQSGVPISSSPSARASLAAVTPAALTQSARESEEDHSQLWAQTHAWNRQTSALLFSSALQNAAPEATARLPQPQASSSSSHGFTTAGYGFPGKWQLPTENLGCCHHNAITTQALLIAFLYRFSIKGVVKQNGPNKEASASHHTFLVFTTLYNNFPELTKLPISAEAVFYRSLQSPSFLLCIWREITIFCNNSHNIWPWVTTWGLLQVICSHTSSCSKVLACSNIPSGFNRKIKQNQNPPLTCADSSLSNTSVHNLRAATSDCHKLCFAMKVIFPRPFFLSCLLLATTKISLLHKQKKSYVQDKEPEIFRKTLIIPCECVLSFVCVWMRATDLFKVLLPLHGMLPEAHPISFCYWKMA